MKIPGYGEVKDPRLGRALPPDFSHIKKYPYRAAAPFKVEKKLKLPYWHKSWDQGREGACVGFGCSMMLSIINEYQARKSLVKPYVHTYNARWLWNEAKKIDQWPDTNPGDDNGTSVRAAMDVLRDQGHVRIKRRVDQPVALDQGIQENRWATTVDDIRAAINNDIPVAIGVNWYSNFYAENLVKKGKETWITDGDLGYVAGGHAVCLVGASDHRQAFLIKNSWGADYPLVWIPYKVMERLLKEEGEATLVTDR